jgi:2-iminobutanoate/2-iminopropanoate deaminase
MPEFINPSKSFPICDAVIFTGRMLETVIVPIPDGSDTPVEGGPAAETREVFRQLDEVLAAAGARRSSVVSVRLFLADVNRDIAEVNAVYKEYFAGCSPMRIAVGVQLQKGMLVEAQFLVEIQRS